MQATEALLDLQPAAIEHIDRPLFDQTRGQREFQAVRDLLDLDAQPCEAILIVEFFDGAKDKLAQMAKAQARPAPVDFENRARAKPGLGACARPACRCSPAARARPSRRVSSRTRRCARAICPPMSPGLQELMARVGVEASFYGHAAAGLLHVRPVLDLHRADDLKKFRQIADEVAALVAQFKGSLAGEHGVGIARTEYLKQQVGAGTLPRDARDQAGVRSEQSFQSRQNHRRRALQN